MLRRIAIPTLLAASACGDDPAMSVDGSKAPAVNVHVALHNVSTAGALATSDGGGVDIVLSSGVAVALLPPVTFFEVGASASGTGLEALAEDGAPVAFHDELTGRPDEFPIVVQFSAPYGAGENGDLLDPGNTVRIDFTAPPDARFAFAMMFAQSNDAFVATVPEGIEIGEAVEERDITSEISIYDAGTEVGEEPGLGENQAPRQASPDTGTDEGGVVTRIEGSDPQGNAFPDVAAFLSATIRIDDEPPID